MNSDTTDPPSERETAIAQFEQEYEGKLELVCAMVLGESLPQYRQRPEKERIKKQEALRVTLNFIGWQP